MNSISKWILLLGIILIASAASGSDKIEDSNSKNAYEYQNQLLDRIIFPSISVTNITIVDFVGIIVPASIEYDPDHSGMSIIINSAGLGPRLDTYEWKKFSLSETNITYRQLIEKACSLSECKWTMEQIPIVEPK